LKLTDVAIALLRRNADEAISAAERYIKAREEEAVSIGEALNDTSAPDIVNFFCTDAAAAALVSPQFL
jgi:hypothetical protein